MTYKARRTRDLQGEVKAGTNVSVSETTKPDGTKVFTLSADSGEIQTLADIINSTTQFTFSFLSGDRDGTPIIYCNSFNEIVTQQGDFYNITETTYEGFTIGSIQVKQKGVYEISTHIEVMIETTGTPTLEVCQAFLGEYKQGQFEWNVVLVNQAQKSDGTSYIVTFDWSGYIELDAMAHISVTGEFNAFYGIISSIGTPGNDPYISIRKIR